MSKHFVVSKSKHWYGHIMSLCGESIGWWETAKTKEDVNCPVFVCGC